MLRLFVIIIAATACGGSKPAAEPTPTARAAKRLILVDAQGVGLDGHDPVAYAADKAAVPGAAEHTSQHDGATYRFASAEHKSTFDAAPAKHAPQYGGYCAYAASLDRLSDSDPTVFQILDGQLLVFTNEDFKLKFNQDVAGNKAKADANWPGLVDKHGK
jgi:YHS domain-containing protein